MRRYDIVMLILSALTLIANLTSTVIQIIGTAAEAQIVTGFCAGLLLVGQAGAANAVVTHFGKAASFLQNIHINMLSDTTLQLSTGTM